MGGDLDLALNLGRAPVRANVHPVVLFSILDHFIRRKEDQHRVIGTLLGYVENGVVEVRNCFPVPHTETDQVAVDMAFHRTMFELHQKANSKEVIVGWYTTGDDINDHSALIHGFYEREMGAAVPSSTPVHLCVDTNLTGGNMAIKAYVSEPFGVNAASGSQLFQPIELTHANKTDVTGVESLMACRQDDAQVSTPISETSNLRVAFRALLSRVDAVTRYVDDVMNGHTKPDGKIGRYLSETLECLSLLNEEEYHQLYNNSLQDHLMTVYLSNLTKTQLALVQKLHNVNI